MKKSIEQTSLRGLDPFTGYGYFSKEDITLYGTEAYIDGLIYMKGNNIELKKVAIIGGSTSDLNYNGSWLRPLQKNLDEYGLEIVTASVSGYSTTQELLRLIRDLVGLKPVLVISLNGVNDLGFMQSVSCKYPRIHSYQARLFQYLNFKKSDIKNKPAVMFNSFTKKAGITMPSMNDSKSVSGLNYGAKSNKSDYEIWEENIKMKYAICSTFDIDYLSVLQPIMGFGTYEMESEEKEFLDEYNVSRSPVNRVSYIDAVNTFYNNAKEISKKYDYILDATEIFSLERFCYLDPRHPNDKGNKIIADFIFKNIETVFPK